MTDHPSKTSSSRVQLLVMSLLAVLVVALVTAAVLRDAHMDKAKEAFLSDVDDKYPNAEVASDTLECHESLSAGLFRDETVHCKADAAHRGQPGRFIGYMPPDFEWVDVAFHSAR